METRRVIYNSYQPYAIALARILQADLNWQPVYWVTHENSSETVKQLFPGVITHDFRDAIKGRPVPSYEADSDAINPDLLKKISFHESVAINMMNRNELDVVFPYQERLRLYHRHVRFYSNLLNQLKPDYIVFEDTPHQACDYVLYTLANERGIQTLLFENGILPDYFLPMSKFEEGSGRLRDEYKAACIQGSLVIPQISEYTRNELEKIKGDYAAGMYQYMKANHSAFQKTIIDTPFIRVINKSRSFLKFFNPLLLSRRIQTVFALGETAANNYYKKKGKPIEESLLSNWDYLIALRNIKKRKTKNLRYYKSKQNNNPDFDLPFVFCPLHFQPEKSTSPWGGYFSDQYLMVEMISKSLPHGWKIYVKDHISQYLHAHTGEPARSPSFYDDLLKLGNVELIAMDLPSYDLIDKAKITASVTGSALWESVVRGKPSFAFGVGHYTWCGDCEGIFYTPDLNSLKKAFNTVIGGYKVNRNKVALFASLVEKNSFRGYVGGPYQAKASGMSAEENAMAHAHAIKSIIHSSHQ